MFLFLVTIIPASIYGQATLGFPYGLFSHGRTSGELLGGPHGVGSRLDNGLALLPIIGVATYPAYPPVALKQIKDGVIPHENKVAFPTKGVVGYPSVGDGGLGYDECYDEDIPVVSTYHDNLPYGNNVDTIPQVY